MERTYTKKLICLLPKIQIYLGVLYVDLLNLAPLD